MESTRKSFNLFDADNVPTDYLLRFLSDLKITCFELDEVTDELQRRYFPNDLRLNQTEQYALNQLKGACPGGKLLAHLTRLGFLNETKPTQNRYNYAVWLGDSLEKAADRFDDLMTAWENGTRWDTTVILCSRRHLSRDLENYQACCKEIGILSENSIAHSSWHLIKPKTEHDMMSWIWQVFKGQHQGFFLAKQPLIIDVPFQKENGEYIHRTREDAIIEWLKQKPKQGSILVSAGAPYGICTDEIFWRLLHPKGFTVETFGHAAPNLTLEALMKEVAECIYQIYKSRLR